MGYWMTNDRTLNRFAASYVYSYLTREMIKVVDRGLNFKNQFSITYESVDGEYIIMYYANDLRHTIYLIWENEDKDHCMFSEKALGGFVFGKPFA